MEKIDDTSFDGGNDIIRYKIVFIGDVSVGKTSFMNRIVENKFKSNYEPSIGVDFSTKIIKHRNKTLKLQIWDSAGQERYKGLIPCYIKGAALVFIVYDINSKDFILGKQTFDNVATWISFAKNIEESILCIIGNKLDLERNVEYSEGESLATKEGALFFEVSTKNNENVFTALYESIANFSYFNKMKISKSKIVLELMSENGQNLVEAGDMASPIIPNKPVSLCCTG